MKTKNIEYNNNSKNSERYRSLKGTSVAILEVLFESELILGMKMLSKLDDTFF